MSISLAEAFERLNAWRDAKTSLQVHVSLEKPGLWADVWGVVREAKDTIVEIASDATVVRIGLREALFEWRDDSPSSSNFSAALLATFSNGDKILFSALRERDAKYAGPPVV